jgi:hypothetical protein
MPRHLISRLDTLCDQAQLLGVTRPVVFEIGQERLAKCFAIEFGMKRVRWA